MKPKQVCNWFLKCDQPAVTTRYHPIIGDVPICQRCNDKIKNLDPTEADKEAMKQG